jgi:hypothetical protein
MRGEWRGRRGAARGGTRMVDGCRRWSRRGEGWETEGGDDGHRKERWIRVQSRGGNDLIYRGGGMVVGRVVTWADGGLWWVGSVYECAERALDKLNFLIILINMKILNKFKTL